MVGTEVSDQLCPFKLQKTILSLLHITRYIVNTYTSVQGILLIHTHYYNQGYKELPLFNGVRHFKPFIQNAADISHNLKNFVDVSWVLLGLGFRVRVRVNTNTFQLIDCVFVHRGYFPWFIQKT